VWLSQFFCVLRQRHDRDTILRAIKEGICRRCATLGRKEIDTLSRDERKPKSHFSRFNLLYRVAMTTCWPIRWIVMMLGAQFP